MCKPGQLSCQDQLPEGSHEEGGGREENKEHAAPVTSAASVAQMQVNHDLQVPHNLSTTLWQWSRQFKDLPSSTVLSTQGQECPDA